MKNFLKPQNIIRLFGIIALSAVIIFTFGACDNGSTGGGGGGGLKPEIDQALVGTSWKDNAGGTSLTVSFTASGITWGGTAGTSLNSTTSAYQGSGYKFVWIAKGGAISYKYQGEPGNKEQGAIKKEAPRLCSLLIVNCVPDTPS